MSNANGGAEPPGAGPGEAIESRPARYFRPTNLAVANRVSIAATAITIAILVVLGLGCLIFLSAIG